MLGAPVHTEILLHIDGDDEEQALMLKHLGAPIHELRLVLQPPKNLIENASFGLARHREEEYLDIATNDNAASPKLAAWWIRSLLAHLMWNHRICGTPPCPESHRSADAILGGCSTLPNPANRRTDPGHSPKTL